VAALIVCLVGAAASTRATDGHAVVTQGSCGAAQVKRVVYAFAAAFNRGDQMRLRTAWAAERHFKWYSVTRASTEHYVTYSRSVLLRYFSARHRRGESLTLNRFKFNGISAGHGHFEYGLVRRAPDIAAGAPEPYHGKGAASCAAATPRLAVWSMARDSPARTFAATARRSGLPAILWAVNVDPQDWGNYYGPSIRRSSWRGPVVHRLTAGTYRIRLHDVSADANFRFHGPGLRPIGTTFEFTGTRTFTVRLRPGVYEYSRLGRENGQILPQPDGFQRRTIRVGP
jgi:hypothetical protein